MCAYSALLTLTALLVPNVLARVDEIRLAVARHSNCDLVEVDGSTLSRQQFDAIYRDRMPVMIRNGGDRSFAARATPTELRRRFGETQVTLSTGNTASYEKSVSRFGAHLDTLTTPLAWQQLQGDAEHIKYHFGDNDVILRTEIDDDSAEWAHLLARYQLPDYFVSQSEVDAHGSEPKFPFDKHRVAFSFGVAQQFSGVPFHTHGAVFAEVIHGAKHWMISEPSHKPSFDGRVTSAKWLLDSERDDSVLHCTARQGDVLYLPSEWWHSTLNIGDGVNVFLSAFV
ncbi:MAG: hypothetical protein MHM6MM_005666 [Cercozoa sp. M6MM]